MVSIAYDPVSPASSCLGDPNDQLESLIHGGYVHLCFPNGFLFCVLPEKALSEKRDGITEPPHNKSLSCIA